MRYYLWNSPRPAYPELVSSFPHKSPYLQLNILTNFLLSFLLLQRRSLVAIALDSIAMQHKYNESNGER